MNNDLISREALKKWADESVAQYGNQYSTDMLNMFGLFKEVIDNAPTVEPFCPYMSDNEVKQPCIESPCDLKRPQGEWIPLSAHNIYKCSECGRTIEVIIGETLSDYPFCHCGAEMRGE